MKMTLTNPTMKPKRLAWVVLAVLCGACGGEAAVADLDTDSTASPAAATTSLKAADAVMDSAEWRDQLGGQWSALQAAREEAARVFIASVLDEGISDVEASVALFDADAAALALFNAELPSPPADSPFATSYNLFVQASAAEEAVTVSIAQELEADTNALRAEYEEATDQSTTRYVELRLAYNTANDATLAACFDLQAAIDDAGLNPFICLPDDGAPIGEEESASADPDFDPTVEPTSLFEPVLLAPGRHQFAVFDRTLAIATDEALRVETGPGVVSLSPEGADFGMAVLAVDNVADPARLDEAEDATVPTFPLPDDVQAWIDSLPLIVNDSGTQTIGGIEAQWWDISVDPAGTAGVLPDPIFVLLDPRAAPWHGLVDDTSRQRTWFVNTPSGPVFLLATGAPWVETAEMLAFAESIFPQVDWD